MQVGRADASVIRRFFGRRLSLPPADDRYARLREIEGLDPVADCVRINYLSSQDFQACNTFLLLWAYYLTYACPRMSRILAASGELQFNLGKRLIDTVILDQAMSEHGYNRGPGREAVRRMNQMHRAYGIHPDDFVFIGCTSALMHVRHAEDYGWRPITTAEVTAVVEAWKLRGRYMGLEFPETIEAMDAHARRCFDEGLAFEPQNQALAETLRDFALSPLPLRLRPLMLAMHYSTFWDPRVVTMCGQPMPGRSMRWLARRMVRLYARLDPMPDGPSERLKDMIAGVYPNGYEISGVGTHVRPAVVS